MKYIGLQKQISSNNKKSILLLLGFPAILLGAVYSVLILVSNNLDRLNFEAINESFIEISPYILIGTGIWFFIAYLGHSSMIDYASKAKGITRKENMRVYNLTENLCMSVGMNMPKLKIIESGALNAFASGLNKKNYSVTLTRGIIEKLNDDELEGVIAHELMHIRNNDVKLLVISIIFVGIFSLIIQIAFRGILYGNMGRSRKKDGKGSAALLIIILLVSIIAYLISLLFKFAISRKREFLADAGAAEMTRKPNSLANALKKISSNSKIESIRSDDIKQLFIDNSPDTKSKNILSNFRGLFSTHPPIEERIKILNQF